VRLELFRYDNRANPQDVNPDLEWGWRTAFDNAGLVANLGRATQIKMQAMTGRTRMGFPRNGVRWIDNRFRSAFALASHGFGPVTVTVRADLFDSRNKGSIADDEYDETGWSAMIAAKRDFGRFTGLVELLHVSNSRESLEDAGLDPRQRQTQIQADLRMHW
jgi:hypothetical protein